MRAAALKEACQEAARRDPKLKGLQPKVSQQSVGRYLLLFSYSDDLPDGKKLNKTSRVVVDEDGHIIKMSASRG